MDGLKLALPCFFLTERSSGHRAWQRPLTSTDRVCILDDFIQTLSLRFTKSVPLHQRRKALSASEGTTLCDVLDGAYIPETLYKVSFCMFLSSRSDHDNHDGGDDDDGWGSQATNIITS
ncbi:hypothetical protein M406DRAFT_56185 [Cryphonectria parasitica EP155]|uniref:Uncharacterized protein n=1 Tax=Cryphonectria parasitica (strain ATCC 38755 / EP155) TaxID=660469 RepID=A0A9P4Y8U8_CRYP1|nr:uncharacterized protein M406DRAFT_56185 [Cryphonectria parasitica EP155]KAF3768626.1 hypothetical protein M406DRAFT_56185 [Cryphonectria parasitica EP155]